MTKHSITPPISGHQNLLGQVRPSLAEFADSFEPGLVSIIIPCYNNADFIAEAIDSALSQTYANTEVIVIDDGSTDGSLEVIRCYGDRINWRTKANAGAPAARNDGLELARGEFIQFLDGDDLLADDAITRRLDAFEPNVDAVFGDLQDIDAKGRQLRGRGNFNAAWPPEDLCVYILTPDIQTTLPLHRRKNVYRIGGFDEGLPCCQEPNLHLRLVCQCDHRFKHLPGVVTYRRLHESADRIGNAPWVRKDPWRYMNICRGFLAVLQEHAPDRLSGAFRDEVAQIDWGRGLQAGTQRRLDVALAYFREALRIQPELQPRLPLCRHLAKGLGRTAGGVVSAWLLSLWYAVKRSQKK